VLFILVFNGADGYDVRRTGRPQAFQIAVNTKG
jgi:hypothetical protein